MLGRAHRVEYSACLIRAARGAEGFAQFNKLLLGHAGYLRDLLWRVARVEALHLLEYAPIVLHRLVGLRCVPFHLEVPGGRVVGPLLWVVPGEQPVVKLELLDEYS